MSDQDFTEGSPELVDEVAADNAIIEQEEAPPEDAISEEAAPADSDTPADSDEDSPPEGAISNDEVAAPADSEAPPEEAISEEAAAADSDTADTADGDEDSPPEGAISDESAAPTDGDAADGDEEDSPPEGAISDETAEPDDSDEESPEDAISDEAAPRARDDDDKVSESDLDNEGDIAADYLEEFLDIVDLDGDIDTYTEGERAHVSIVTDSQVLVGRDGEVLDALQELVRLAVLTETGHRSRLILDIGGHREKRRKELLIMAQEAVAEVELTGEAVRLPAMNPYERKIVHDAVAESGYASESEGVEPQRRVVVSTK